MAAVVAVKNVVVYIDRPRYGNSRSSFGNPQSSDSVFCNNVMINARETPLQSNGGNYMVMLSASASCRLITRSSATA